MGKHSKIEPEGPSWAPDDPAEAPPPAAESPSVPATTIPPSPAIPPSPTIPPSDVSAMVGLVGLAGLLVWVYICRGWPYISDSFGLPGPHVALSGPHAALAAVAATALPMVVWSLLVDKVHRHPATGIDWANPRPLADIIDISTTKLVGLWATWAVIGFVFCIERFYWQGQWRFAMDVLGALVLPMVLLSVPYVLWLDRVLVNPRDASWHFGAMLVGREAYEPAEVARHLRAWAVKGFFTAFMLLIVAGGFGQVVSFDWNRYATDPVALTNWLINALFMVDIQIGTVGYLLTFRPLNAHIRSANPFATGWIAALICYPPFVLMGDGSPLNYHVNTSDWSSWMASWPHLEWVWGAWMVLLTGIYAWATMAFGIRFSNLTYRGVLTNGPYRYTRHPAYLAKNIFWWCSGLPFLVTSHSLIDAVRNTTLMACVSAVYYWRARTEERHLCAEDPKYRAYHAWMEEHGLVTSRLAKLGRWLGWYWRRSGKPELTS